MMGRNRLLPLLFVIGCLVLSLPPATFASEAPWPTFRHDSAHTARSPYVGPTDGVVAWRCGLNGPGLGSPAVDGGRVYATGGGKLTAVSLGGEVLWSASYGGGSSSPAVAADGTVYLASTDSNLYAFNSDGTLKWKRSIPGSSECSPTVGSDGTVYVGCTASRFLAYRPDGTLKYSYTPGGAVASSAAIAADGTAYFGCDDGSLYAIRSTGALKWKFATNPVGAIKSSPSLGADGTVYFGTMNGYFYAVWPGGTQRWRYSAGGAVYSSPAIFADGSLCFGCRDRNVYCLSASGGLRWRFATGQYVDSSPAIDASVVAYVGSNDGSLYAIDSDGSVAWSLALGAAVSASPAIGDDGTIYVSTQGGELCAILGDLTPPLAPVVADDGEYSTSPNTLHASWTCADPESGIYGYEYAIGSSPGNGDVVPFTAAGTATEVTRTDLLISNGGSYFFSVRATNGAGLMSPIGISDGIRVDVTQPVVQSVDVGVSMQEMRIQIHATDPESSVVASQCALLTSPEAPVSPGWIAGTPEGAAVIPGPFSAGWTYYIASRVRNGAGVWSTVNVTGPIQIDGTPPAMPIVTDDGDITSIPDCLHAQLSSSDAESGVAGYEYCIGMTPGGTEIVPWTSCGTEQSVTVCGLQLQSGTRYYFAARATNGVGLVSAVGVSDGIEFRRGVSAWPKFRADARNTGRATGMLPLSAKLRWKVQSAGYVESSAAIGSDGTVYIGSSDGKLYAISAVGTVRWLYDAGSPVDSSPALSSDGNIYFGAYNGLHCVSQGGVLRWKVATPGMVWSSPAVGYDGTIYFGCHDHKLYAVSPAGSVKWTYETGGTLWVSPAIADDGTIYAASGDGKLYAMAPSGTLKWSYQTGSAIDSSPAVGDDGVVYFGSGDGCFYAVNPNGALRWRVRLGLVVDSSPAVTQDGRVYVGTGAAGSPGSLYALTTAGSELWRVELPEGIRSSPAVDPVGNVCVGCSNGRLYVLDRCGHVAWSYVVGDSIQSSPAVGADGSLVIGSDDGCIYCFREHFIFDTTPPSAPVVSVNHEFVTPEMPVSARWSSSDPESGIESYSYAIGTQPGGDDVVNWTNAGFGTSMSRSSLPLVIGRSYYVSVTAMNYALLRSPAGVSRPVTVVSGEEAGRIGVAKKRLPGTQVSLPGKVVTAVFDDCVFVEEPDRSAGIRCVVLPSGVQVGAVVTVQGLVGFRYGETVLYNAAVTPAGFAGSVRPLGLPCEVLARIGLDATGLLVRVSGEVTRVGTDYFMVWDGSRLQSPRGTRGIEIRLASGEAAPSVGEHVCVTGIACREIANSQATLVLRALPGAALLVLDVGD